MKKFIIEFLRYTVMIVCWVILAWFGYWAFIGFTEAEVPEDYEVTYPY